MKTTILTSLHELSVRELELIEKCKERVTYFEKMIKLKEENNLNCWAYSFAELVNDIKRSKRIEKRVYTWYLQTLNKIMRYSIK